MKRHSSSVLFVCLLSASTAPFVRGAFAFHHHKVAAPWRSSRSFFLETSTPISTSTSALHDAAPGRSICTFDPTDFAAPTGGAWPYTTADMNRLDNTADTSFYTQPRFVTHIDDKAIGQLTVFYAHEFQALLLQKQQQNKLQSSIKEEEVKLDVLDLCSSWISHLPIPTTTTADGIQYGRVVGIGMNEQELQANQQLSEYFVQDLNQQPLLTQLEDNSFDVVCNVVSVDYLTKPRLVFEEIHRILRPNGVALMSFSNRCFPTKAVNVWLQADDIGRLTIVASYFHYTADWKSIEAMDLKDVPLAVPERPSFQDLLQNPTKGFAWMNTAAAVAKSNQGDPMFVVKGVK
jgi:SAM-dependent methyltransferase